MTTTDSTITADMTPAEAANLLARLEEGHQAAWQAARESRSQGPEGEPRLRNAVEVDGIYRDVLQETLETGMRHPGESVEQFAKRAAADARLADERTADNETVAGPVTQLSDPSTPLGQAYTRAFSDAAAAHVRELRARDPLPEPDRTPGAPHPDPVLASRGWHVNEHGIYTRRVEHQPPQMPPERDLEAGT